MTRGSSFRLSSSFFLNLAPQVESLKFPGILEKMGKLKN